MAQPLNLKSNELLHPLVPRLLAEALAGVPEDAVQRYPRRDDIRDRVARFHGVPSGEVILAAGSDAAIQTIAAMPGHRDARRLVLQTPNYEPWETYATIHGLRVTPVSLATGAAHFLDRLAAVLADAQPSLVAVSNPNGPVGHTFAIDQLRPAVELCGRRGHLLVVDQCYAPFVGLDHVAAFEDLEHVVVVSSFSKGFGLAGARIASVVAHGEAGNRLRDSGVERTVSGPSALLLAHMLERTEQLREVWADLAESRAWFTAAMCEARPGWTALPTTANFVTFAGPNPAAADEFHHWMGLHGIRVRSLADTSGFEHCVRFTVADRATMEDVMSVVAAAPR